MKLSKKNHYNAIAFYSILFFEIVVSGYFCKLDGFFFLTRIGIYLISFAVIEIGYLHVLKWVGLILVILSFSGIREKWQALEKEKFEKNSSLEETKIKSPEKPIPEKCEILAKWARVDCVKGNQGLQLTFQEERREYNKKISKVENKIKNLDTSLDFYDTQPILIYCILMCALTWLSVISAKKPEVEKEVKTKKENGLSNLEKVKLIEKRNEQEKISQGLLCKEYGISLSEFKRIRAKDKPKIEPLTNLRILGKRESA